MKNTNMIVANININTPITTNCQNKEHPNKCQKASFSQLYTFNAISIKLHLCQLLASNHIYIVNRNVKEMDIVVLQVRCENEGGRILKGKILLTNCLVKRNNRTQQCGLMVKL